MRWFGSAWPSAELRAPICDDDAYKVATPTGLKCLYCEQPIEEDDRGLVMACNISKRPEFTFTIWASWDEGDPELHLTQVCVYHLDCLVESTVGPEIAKQVSQRKS